MLAHHPHVCRQRSQGLLGPRAHSAPLHVAVARCRPVRRDTLVHVPLPLRGVYPVSSCLTSCRFGISWVMWHLGMVPCERRLTCVCALLLGCSRPRRSRVTMKCVRTN